MLGLIGNLDISEIIIILVVALIVFGERLPEVAMRGAAQLVRLRRTLSKMWREAGLEEELRRMQRDIDRKMREVPPPSQIFEEPEDETDETEEPGEPGEKDQTDESSDPAADEDAEVGATGPLAATDAAEAGSSGEVEHGASEAAGGPYALDDRRELPPDDDGDEAAGQVDSPERADADDSDSGDSEAAGRETA